MSDLKACMDAHNHKDVLCAMTSCRTCQHNAETFVRCTSCGRVRGHTWQCPVLGRIVDDVGGNKLR